MNYFDSRSSLRVSDFFCVIGLEDEIIPFCQATRIMGMGSVDNLMEVPFSATVLDRYPLFDRVDAVFPEGVELFCFPEGIKLYDSIPPPSFHSFIHTSEEGIHSLGCCLKFYEPMEVMHCDRLKALFPSKNDELDDSNYFVPKSLCLISRWPFIESFREVLCQFYRLSLSQIELPIERYICNFIDDVPAPPKEGQKDINYYILDQMIKFKCPPLNQPNSWSSLPAQPLFECLNPENIVNLFTAILIERQVVFISSQLSLLTSAAEGITSLMYPLRWVHVYVPVLPLPLIGILAAPLPFIVGILSTYLAEEDCYIGEESVRVYLDENKIDFGTLGPPPTIPERRRKKLISAINTSGNAFANRDDNWRKCILPLYDSAYSMSVRPNEVDGVEFSGQVNELEIRCAFLNFFVAIFMDYRKYMVTDSRRERFKFDQFLDDCSDKNRDFYELLLNSQSFSQFIESRQLMDERDPDVAFFDESIHAKRNRSSIRMSTIETPLLSDTETYMNSKTHIPTKADSSGLPPQNVDPSDPNKKQLYSYPERFPKLQAMFYSPLRPHSVTLGESMSLRSNHTSLKRSGDRNRVSSKGSDLGASTPGGPQRLASMKRTASISTSGSATTATSSSVNTPRSGFRFGFATDASMESEEPDLQLDSDKTSNFKNEAESLSCVGSVLSTYICITAQLARHQAMRSNKKRWGKLPLSTRQILIEYGGGKGTGTTSRMSEIGDDGAIMDSRSTNSSQSGSHPSSNNTLSSSTSSNNSRKLGLGGSMTVGGHNVHRQGALEVNRIGSTEIIRISSSASDVGLPEPSPSADISLLDSLGRSNSTIASIMSTDPEGIQTLGFGELSIPDGNLTGRTSPVDSIAGDLTPPDSPPPEMNEYEEDLEDRKSSRNRARSISPQLSNSTNGCKSGSFDGYDATSLNPLSFEDPTLIGPIINAFDCEGSTLDIALRIMEIFHELDELSDDMPFRLLGDAIAISFDPLRAAHLMAIMEAIGILPDSKIASSVSIAFSSSTSYFLSTLSALDVLRSRHWDRLFYHLKNRGIDGLEEYVLDLNERKNPEELIARRQTISAAVAASVAASSNPEATVSELENLGFEHLGLEEKGSSSSPINRWSSFRSNFLSPSSVDITTTMSESTFLNDRNEDQEDYDDPYNLEWIDFQTYQQSSESDSTTPKWQRRYTRCISQNLLIRMQWSDERISSLLPDLVIDLNHEYGTTCPNSLCGCSFTVPELDELWEPDPNQYTITCPHCDRPFVPRFVVFSSGEDWVGSDGPKTELWCEFLSPWTLRKEVLIVLREYGIDTLISSEFRKSSHQHCVVFWNLVVALRLRGLPYSFLLS